MVLLGLSLIAAGAYVQVQEFTLGGAAGVLLAPLGVSPEGFFMPDYRPLLPWFGVVLLGVFFGNAVYLAWRKKTPPSPTPRTAALSPSWAGTPCSSTSSTSPSS